MIALLVALAFAAPQDSGKLKKFERTFARDDKDDRTSSSDDRKDRKRQDRHHSGGGWSSSTQDDCGPREYSLADFFFYPAYDHGRRFQEYPYADSSEWYFVTETSGDKKLAVRSAMSVGRIEHDLWSADFEAAVGWSSGCELRFDIVQLQERVGGQVDRLTIHQYHLTFGGTGGPRNIDFTFGLGVSALEGEEVSDTGFSILGGAVWYPVEPLSLRVSVGLVKFTEESLADVRGELGWHLGRFALTAGVRSLISSGGEDLTGPTLGFALFF